MSKLPPVDVGGWRNPSGTTRIVLVACVFSSLGVVGGIYVNLLPMLRIDPVNAAVMGAVVFAVIGAWFEGCDQ